MGEVKAIELKDGVLNLIDKGIISKPFRENILKLSNGGQSTWWRI